MPHIPRVICSRCSKEMTNRGSEVIEAVTTFGRQGVTPAQPYYKIMADRYQCVDCGVEVYAGMPAQPISEHFQADYPDHNATRRFTFL